LSQEALGEEIQLKSVGTPPSLHGRLHSFWGYEGAWPILTSLLSQHKAYFDISAVLQCLGEGIQQLVNISGLLWA